MRRRPVELAQYVAVMLLLGIVTGLLLTLARPARPEWAGAALVLFAVAVAWPPRRPRRERMPWGQ